MMQEKPTYLQPALFDGLPGIVAGFSTRLGGDSVAPYDSLNLSLSTGDDATRVQENRHRLFEAVGFSIDQLALAGQVHGAQVQVVAGPGRFPGTDGLVTQAPGVLLCISAADCAAVLLADAEGCVVGACHAGWRGAAARIVVRTVAALERLGADAARLRVYISPCISMKNFEVGPEVAARFDPVFVQANPGSVNPHVDLKAVITAQLEETGVAPAHIEVSPHCTFAETDTFFSHRAENGRTGRMMGFIGMRG
ncbi:MAG: peptidoglycan editing factor PgeF [Rhodothermales bacterium]